MFDDTKFSTISDANKGKHTPGSHKIPNPSTHYLPANTNQDMKMETNKDKDPPVHTTTHQSKINSNAEPWRAWPQAQHQALALLSINKPLSGNRQRV